tara:strand:- start:114 stop:1079 length:966 start_codon:yes stop_codon:yes gene_type:complete
LGRDGSGDGMRPEVIQGDVREVLKTLDDESVQCVVTSPPYWGLRDYGVDDQLGLEATPEEFVENMVDVFREVKRVLRNDGTLWLNLGDSYFGGGRGDDSKLRGSHKGQGTYDSMKSSKPDWNKVKGLKPKDLVGIPWRVALALQADGWYLRSDIIWNKPNPMPESVADRPTKSHEYIFLLTKSAKYFYDHEAIKEKGEYPAGTKAAKGSAKRYSTDLVNSRPPEYKVYDGLRNKRSVWKITTKPYKEAHFATFPEELPETCIKAGTQKGDVVLDIFAGSGTTLRVASKLGRKGIGIELNPEYIKILKKRCKIESMSLEAFV